MPLELRCAAGRGRRGHPRERHLLRAAAPTARGRAGGGGQAAQVLELQPVRGGAELHADPVLDARNSRSELQRLVRGSFSPRRASSSSTSSPRGAKLISPRYDGAPVYLQACGDTDRCEPFAIVHEVIGQCFAARNEAYSFGRADAPPPGRYGFWRILPSSSLTANLDPNAPELDHAVYSVCSEDVCGAARTSRRLGARRGGVREFEPCCRGAPASSTPPRYPPEGGWRPLGGGGVGSAPAPAVRAMVRSMRAAVRGSSRPHAAPRTALLDARRGVATETRRPPRYANLETHASPVNSADTDTGFYSAVALVMLGGILWLLVWLGLKSGVRMKKKGGPRGRGGSQDYA